MAIRIADTATVDPRAELADEVEIGPYCVVEAGAALGRGTRLVAHVCLLGGARLGERNLVGPFSVIGADPGGSAPGGRVEIGHGNTIREGCSIERGPGPGGATRVGSGNRVGPHVALAGGASLGDETELGPGVRLGASAIVESLVRISGGVEVHPGASVGELSFVGGPGRVARDVPRFLRADGSPARPRGVNLVGLRARGASREAIRSLREAYRLLFRAGLDWREAARSLVDHGLMTREVARLLESLTAQRAGRHGRARDAAA